MQRITFEDSLLFTKSVKNTWHKICYLICPFHVTIRIWVDVIYALSSFSHINFHHSILKEPKGYLLHIYSTIHGCVALRVGVFWYPAEEQGCLHVHIYVPTDPGLQPHLYAKQQTLCPVTQTLQQWLPIIYRHKMTKCQLCKELSADKQTSLCRFLSVKLQYQRQGSFILEDWADFFSFFLPSISSLPKQKISKFHFFSDAT